MNADLPLANLPKAPPRTHLVALVIFSVSVIAYLNAVRCGFAYDDIQLLEKNPGLGADMMSVLRTWGEDYWSPLMESGLYRPLTKMTYSLERLLFSAGPPIHHLTNVLLHGLVSVLLFLIALRLQIRSAGAAAASILFALHPLHTEAVTGIVGRADLLSLVFLQGAFLTHLRIPPTGTSIKRTLVPALLFLLGMMSKEIAASYLAIIVFYDLISGTGRRLFPSVFFYLLAIGVQFGARALATGTMVPEPPFFINNPLIGADAATRWMTATSLFGLAVVQNLIPVRLCADYSFQAIVPSTDITSLFLIGLVCSASLAFLLVTWGRRDRRVWIAAAFFGATYGITANLVVLIGTIYGERLLYLPSIGCALLAGLVIERALATPPPLRRLIVISLLGTTAVYSVRTTLRNEDWLNEVTLFEACVRDQPESIKGHFLLGLGLKRHQRYAEAEVALRECVRIAPDYDHGYLAIGHLYLETGVLEKAPPPFLKAFKTASTDAVAGEAAWRLGALSLVGGNAEQAEEWLRRAIVRSPENPRFHQDLGAALLAQHKYGEAIIHFRRARQDMQDNKDLAQQLRDAQRGLE